MIRKLGSTLLHTQHLRQRQEDQEFKARFSHRSVRQARASSTSVSEHPKQTNYAFKMCLGKRGKEQTMTSKVKVQSEMEEGL